jgi:hypothetical protein
MDINTVFSFLQEIVHSPNVTKCLEGSSEDHPCCEINRSQGVNTIINFQVPESRNGYIETSCLQFLNSYPSIREIEEYPPPSIVRMQSLNVS